MADPRHLELLAKGARKWNGWRDTHPSVVPDLADANLSDARLFEFDLSCADLTGCQFHKANLFKCSLRSATARRANFTEADLTCVDLESADLGEALLEGSLLWKTRFRNTNLAGAIGLERCRHRGESLVDAWTLTRSGDLPSKFLKGFGLKPAETAHLENLEAKFRKYRSCFVSYSSLDQEFVVKLCADLTRRGVPHFFAPEHLPIGTRIRPRIHRAIQEHEKLLVVISRASIGSPWVEDEVEHSMERERLTGRDCVFPVRIDEALFASGDGWATTLRTQRHIGDFSRWRESDFYEKALGLLMRDLRIESNMDGVPMMLRSD
jgi:hypothetical protein